MAWFRLCQSRLTSELMPFCLPGLRKGYTDFLHSSETNLECCCCGQNSAFEKILDFGPQFIVNLKVLLVVLIPQRPRRLKVSGRKGCVPSSALSWLLLCSTQGRFLTGKTYWPFRDSSNLILKGRNIIWGTLIPQITMMLHWEPSCEHNVLLIMALYQKCGSQKILQCLRTLYV